LPWRSWQSVHIMICLPFRYFFDLIKSLPCWWWDLEWSLSGQKSPWAASSLVVKFARYSFLLVPGIIILLSLLTGWSFFRFPWGLLWHCSQITDAREGPSFRGLTISDAFFSFGAFTCSEPGPWHTSHPMFNSLGVPSPSMSASPSGSFTAPATKSPETLGVR